MTIHPSKAERTWTGYVEANPAASKTQIGVGARTRREQSGPQYELPAIKTHSQQMTHQEEADFPRVPWKDASGRRLRADEGNFLKPCSGAAALHGVQPFESAPAAVVQPGVVLGAENETGGAWPRAGLVSLPAGVVSLISSAEPSGIPKLFEFVERIARQRRMRIHDAERDRQRHGRIRLCQMNALRGHGHVRG